MHMVLLLVNGGVGLSVFTIYACRSDNRSLIESKQRGRSLSTDIGPLIFFHAIARLHALV